MVDFSFQNRAVEKEIRKEVDDIAGKINEEDVIRGVVNQVAQRHAAEHDPSFGQMQLTIMQPPKEEAEKSIEKVFEENAFEKIENAEKKEKDEFAVAKYKSQHDSGHAGVSLQCNCGATFNERFGADALLKTKEYTSGGKEGHSGGYSGGGGGTAGYTGGTEEHVGGSYK